MNSLVPRSESVRVVPAALATGCMVAPLRLLAAGDDGVHVMGLFDVVLIFGVGVAVGLVVWRWSRRKQQHLARQAENRIREMTALIEHADCLLWEAEVDLSPKDWIWRMTLHNSAFCRKVFLGQAQTPGVDLWRHFQIENREAMNRRARTAMEEGQPGYEQEFRAIRDSQVYWMHEKVSITRLAANRFWLVGLVTDITAQREAEEARRQSELTVNRILEHAHCLLWRATVIEEGGVLMWPHFDVPHSQLSQRLFGDRTFSAEIGFWGGLGMPEQAEMNERSSRAILGGAPGYAQQFRAINKSGRVFWLNEQVSITPTGDRRWSLVGVVTDITVQREAEEARQRSETQLAHLLERADSMLWQAKVERLADGRLDWTMYVPKSQVYRRIFASDPENPVGFAWDRNGVPEHAEMEHRSVKAIEEGVSSYEQVFHVPRPTGDIWLSETVTIEPTGPTSWDLVGIITDITAQRRAEVAQQKSELRLSALLDRADCMIWQGEARRLGPDDIRWKVFTPNSQLYRRLFVRDPDGECHFPWDNGLVPEQPEMKQRAIDALTGGLAGYDQNFHYKLPAGDVWLSEQVTINPLGPDHWELVGVITDITDQHKANLARQQSEARLQDILTRANCLLWEATVEMTTGEWKWQFSIQPSLLSQKLHGVPRPRPEDGLWRKFSIPEWASMNERCKTALLENRPGYDQVFHIEHPDGKKTWISENVTVSALGGNRFSLVGVALDITPLRGAEEELAAEKERLAVTLRAMKECVITTDVAGAVQFMNPAAVALTGWQAGDASGRAIDSLFRLQNSRNEQPAEIPIGRVARGDVIMDLPPHTRLVTTAGSRRIIEGCCAPIHAADSKVIGTVLVFRDVTEQERLEQELVRATRLESVGVLAGGIAHDFNNILTAVMGNLALAQLDVEPGTPVGASLRSAEKAALRARDLTQQLLTFAKGGEPVRTAVQLDAIVREMTTFALHGSRVKAHYDIAPDLWPADADKGQIGRVVQNLVINAVQAMPHGGTLQIVVRNDPHDGMSQPGLGPGDYIQIAITDTGDGIKPEHLSRIFDPYFTTKQTGTGLGLAAVYSIVKKHRGHIDVDSQLGKGTTFRIWLPALRDRRAHPDTRTPWDSGASQRMRGRVLFMDDEQSIREMAVMLLQRFGLTVDCAVDGAEAVEKYRASLTLGPRYDLVIMDLTVPGGMGGLAALGRLREIDPAVKAVVSSGYSSDPVLANYRSHGFVAVVAKPYEVHEISRVLREVLPSS